MKPELYTNLSDEAKRYAREQLAIREKSSSTAYLWWLGSLVLINGLHKFYLNKPVWGVVYLLTGGLFYLGTVYDLFTLNSQVEDYNNKLELDIIAEARQLFGNN